MMNGQHLNSLIKIAYWLVIITLLGTFAMPSLLLINSFPKIEISDLTLPVLCLLTFVLKKEQLKSFYKNNRLVILSFSMISIIAVLSIVINGRYTFYRDWFEVLKFVKLLCFMAFFYLYIDLSKWEDVMKSIFLIVIALNVFHYFNIFNYNTYVEIYYAESHHVNFFGLNSIGEPATRRMIGTMGNPNNNALMFLMFLVFFLPTRKEKINQDYLYAAIAIIGVLACQSRTGFIVLAVLLLSYFIVHRIKWSHILFYIGIVIGGFVLLQLAGNTYIGSLSSISHLQGVKAGRMEQWLKIIESMDGLWLFGHGVNKEYFENNDIFAESEYFLILFRYGVVGVLALIGFWSSFFIFNLKNIRNKSGILMYGSLIVFVISGIMNTPLHSTKLSVILMLLIGLGLLYKHEREKI